MKTDTEMVVRHELVATAAAPRSDTPPRAAHWLSGIVAALMLAASAAGLLVDGLYADAAWAREALRGGDLATLVVAAPLLAISLALSIRGSQRAHVIWIAMLGYAVYNYGYYVFGSEWNDVFLLHIAILSLSIIALISATRGIDARAIAARLRRPAAARWVGAFLLLVGIGQGALWVFVVLRYALTGELLQEVPVDGQHLVFAMDLSLLVPALVIGGLLLLRRTTTGYVLGTAVAVFGFIYQLNMMMAGVFQESARVAGAKMFPIEGLVLTAGLAAASAAMLLHRERTG